MAMFIRGKSHSDCGIDDRAVDGQPRLKISSRVVAVAFLLAFTGAVERAAADEFVTLQDYDLPGNDLRTPAQDPKLKQISLADCQLVCLAEEKCSAFTYNDKANWCFLKGGTPVPMSFGGAISGVRASRQTAATKALVSAQQAAGSNESFSTQSGSTEMSSGNLHQAVASAASGTVRETSPWPKPVVSSLPAQRASDPKGDVTLPSPQEQAKKNTTTVSKTSPRFVPSQKVVAGVAPLPGTPLPGAKQKMPAGVQSANLAAPVAAPVSLKPLIDINKNARSLHKSLVKRIKLADAARALSDKYLKMYDKEKAGTKWIDVSSLGMTVPMSVNTQQAKAIVLSKMREDKKLDVLQKQLSLAEKKTSEPFERIANAFKPELRKKLTQLHERKLQSSNAFGVAQGRLRVYGGKLSKRVDETWKMPSATALRRLHALAKEMRKHRLSALNTGDDFSLALKKALETPVQTQTF